MLENLSHEQCAMYIEYAHGKAEYYHEYECGMSSADVCLSSGWINGKRKASMHSVDKSVPTSADCVQFDFGFRWASTVFIAPNFFPVWFPTLSSKPPYNQVERCTANFLNNNKFVKISWSERKILNFWMWIKWNRKDKSNQNHFEKVRIKFTESSVYIFSRFFFSRQNFSYVSHIFKDFPTRSQWKCNLQRFISLLAYIWT